MRDAGRNAGRGMLAATACFVLLAVCLVPCALSSCLDVVLAQVKESWRFRIRFTFVGFRFRVVKA